MTKLPTVKYAVYIEHVPRRYLSTLRDAVEFMRSVAIPGQRCKIKRCEYRYTETTVQCYVIGENDKLHAVHGD